MINKKALEKGLCQKKTYKIIKYGFHLLFGNDIHRR